MDPLRNMVKVIKKYVGKIRVWFLFVIDNYFPTLTDENVTMPADYL
ncbi:MAG: hypothetical protein PUC33_00255 [Oscillospiraceae bacterium]|nr:hypothetical protein [Oscillospiraceae bacterium]MDD6146186.1 hypothetical protein [Oscillospiraceae bacterium]